ncbi:hypothetical protein JIY74_30720 [Vibrio harveyi]|nr:hypothetical protein [Vibrio harveyi]
MSDEVFNENIFDLVKEPEKINGLIDKVKDFLDKNGVEIPSNIHLSDKIIDNF